MSNKIQMKLSKKSLRVIVASLFVFYSSPVLAIGFTEENIFYDYIEILNFLAILSLFLAVVSFIVGFVGQLTGKFRIKMYIPFIFLLLAVIFLVFHFSIDFNFSCRF